MTRRALTMVEVVFSTLIIGVMLTAALSTVAMSRQAEHLAAVRRSGRLLADELLVKALALAYADPQTPAAAPGPDAGDGAGPDGFDDVDDFDGYSSETDSRVDVGGGPLQVAQAEGSESTKLWRTSVTVVWVDPDDPGGGRKSSETGCKRVDVTVTYAGVPAAQAVALRTNAP